MNSPSNKPSLPFGEFITLMAMMMSLVALSIDAILPALSAMSTDLQVVRDNDRQMVVSLLLLGLGFGQLIYGPLSDSIGRKRAIYLGYALFVVGTLCCMAAVDFTWVLIGRIIQGFGIAAARIVTVALIRDLYQGREMARIMSFIMMIFLVVPAVAPALGQSVLLIANWRWVFALMLVVALVSVVWFTARQPETLAPSDRRPFSIPLIVSAAFEVFSYRATLVYTITNGLVFGAFLGVLSLVQQIFQEQYALGKLFPIAFALLSVAIGLGSWLNARLVLNTGMRLLTYRALVGTVVVSSVFCVLGVFYDGHPPLWQLLAFMVIVLFAQGFISGNLNALAMEPLGHMAGIGAALTGAVATLMSVGLGSIIGFSYDNSVLPWPVSFGVLSVISLVVMKWDKAD